MHMFAGERASHRLRGMLQMIAASPTNVSTAVEFASALEAGSLDIVINNHLDLTLLPLPLK